jgi:hypothetical protein
MTPNAEHFEKAHDLVASLAADLPMDELEVLITEHVLAWALAESYACGFMAGLLDKARLIRRAEADR